jgi:hypothetical protein
MTSGPHTRTVTAPALGSDSFDTTNDPDERLRLKPAGPRTGVVDGGWWPRSIDLVDELPALAAALADRIGPVARISYALDGWAPAPRRAKLDGRIVRLEGFNSQDVRILHVTGATDTRLSLRLVPPDTAPEAAAIALRTSVGSATSAPDQDPGRWETDGGST